MQLDSDRGPSEDQEGYICSELPPVTYYGGRSEDSFQFWPSQACQRSGEVVISSNYILRSNSKNVAIEAYPIYNYHVYHAIIFG